MLSLMNSASSSSSSTDESRCSPSSRARTASEMSTALAPAAAITSTGDAGTSVIIGVGFVCTHAFDVRNFGYRHDQPPVSDAS